MELSSVEEYSPVLLAWALLTCSYGDGEPTLAARSLVNRAIQQGAVKIAKRISNDSHFQVTNSNLFHIFYLFLNSFLLLISIDDARRDSQADDGSLSPDFDSRLSEEVR